MDEINRVVTPGDFRAGFAPVRSLEKWHRKPGEVTTRALATSSLLSLGWGSIPYPRPAPQLAERLPVVIPDAVLAALCFLPGLALAGWYFTRRGRRCPPHRVKFVVPVVLWAVVLAILPLEW